MLTLYPSQSYPLEVLCSHYLKTGKSLFTCSVSQKSQNEFRYLKVNKMSNLNYGFFEGAQHDDAVSCFSRLLDLAPGSALGHLGLGTKALQEGRYKDAAQKLKQGESVDQQRWTLLLLFQRHLNTILRHRLIEHLRCVLTTNDLALLLHKG